MMRMAGAISDEDKLSRDEARKVIRRSIRMGKPFRKWAILAAFFISATVSCTIAGPLLVRHGIDYGIKAKNLTSLTHTAIVYVIVAVFAVVVGRLQYIAVNQAGEGFLRLLRITVFAKLQKQSMAFYDREKAGVLVARMTADIDTMADLVQIGLLQFLQAALLLVFSIIVLLRLSWELTGVALVVLPILLIASVKFQRDSNKAYLEVREKVGANLSAMQEGIAGVRVIQAYAREKEQIRRFEQSNQALFKSHIHSVRVSTWYFALVEYSGIAASALAVGIGGWLVHRHSVSVGTVVAFVLLLANLFDPVQQLSQLYNTLQSASAALSKLYAIIDAVPEQVEKPDAVALPNRGDLTVNHVTFAYQGTTRPALDDVSITVADGQRLALVGPTGAGKSTLAKLMARLYDPTSGTVSYGGTDLRDATFASLRERIVVIPQEGFLFNGNIRDNIRVARPAATDDDIIAALKRLDLYERFMAFPEGLDTEVRERGSRLSAGERQLVALSRAALVDPAVLVLDEATSNLDPGTEALMEAALERLMHGRTVIVVAHRLTTVRRADRIAVVNDARVTEYGTHDELMALDGHYATLTNNWNKSQPERE